MNYRQLKQEQADLVAEAKTLFAKAETENRGLNEAEKARDDEIAARMETLKADLAREERRREWERTVEALPAGPRITIHDNALDKPWGYDLCPQKPEAAAMGDFLQAVAKSGQGRGTDPRLMIGAALGASTAVGADGGFLMPTTMANQMMARMTGGQILSRLSPLPLDAGSDTLVLNVLAETARTTGGRKGGVVGYWIAEGEAPTGSRPKFDRAELKTRGVGALGYATDELLRNVSALQTWFPMFFADELRFLAEDATINGTGAGKPMGVLVAPCLVEVAKEAGQLADTIVKENIDKMWSRMYAPSRANAVWLINQEIEPQLDNLTLAVGVGGVPVYLPAGGLSATPYASLKGRPVIPVEYCSALGDKGDIILADWTEYLWIQQGGIENASSIHVAFTTFEQAFRCKWHVDGQPAWRSALTPFKGTAGVTYSPFVTLAAR